jgi:hypothetical protein
VEYTAAEVTELLKESERILAGTSDPKVVRAASKFALASEKAIAESAGLRLNPLAVTANPDLANITRRLIRPGKVNVRVVVLDDLVVLHAHFGEAVGPY